MRRNAVVYLYAIVLVCIAAAAMNVLWFPVFKTLGLAQKETWSLALRVICTCGGTAAVGVLLLTLMPDLWKSDLS